MLCRASERTVERLNHAGIQSLVLQMVLIPNNLATHFPGRSRGTCPPGAGLRGRDSAAHEVIDDILLSRPPRQRVFRRTVESCTLHGTPIPTKSGISVALHAHPAKHGTRNPQSRLWPGSLILARTRPSRVCRPKQCPRALPRSKDRGSQPTDSGGSSTVLISHGSIPTK